MHICIFETTLSIHVPDFIQVILELLDRFIGTADYLHAIAEAAEPRKEPIRQLYFGIGGKVGFVYLEVMHILCPETLYNGVQKRIDEAKGQADLLPAHHAKNTLSII